MAWWLSISASESNVSVANNTSVVTVSLSISWNYGSWANDNPGYSITIDGTTYSGTANFNTGRASSGSQTLATASKTVTHNSDGAKTVGYSGGSYGANKEQGSAAWQSVSSSISLTTIPRASSISVQYSSVAAGSSQKVTATKKSASFTDQLRVYINSTYSMTVTSGTSFTIPLNWMNAIPDALEIECTAEVKTYNGSTLVGTNTAKFKMTCPSYQPTASRTLTPQSTPSAFGSRYVQLLSKVGVSVSASGYYGSSISSIITTIEGLTYSGASVISEYIKGTSVVVSTVVTDSRGKTRTIEETISAIAYHYPRLQLRCQALGSVSKNVVTLVSSISTVNNLNAKSIVSITWTCSDGTSGTLSGTETIADYEGTTIKEHTGIDATLTYTYTARIQDSITYIQQTNVTGIPVISRHAGGDGVAFGAEASRAGFDCHFDAYFKVNGTLRCLVDLIYPVGSIYISVNSTSPQEIFGGTWERLKNCFLYGGVDTTDAYFDWVKECDEGVNFVVTNTDTQYRYGTTVDGVGMWTDPKTFSIGTYLANSATFGNDPAYGYKKIVQKRTRILIGDTGGVVNNDFSDKLHYSGKSYRLGEGSGGSYSDRLVVGISDDTRGSSEQIYTPFNNLNNMPPYLAVYMWKRTA